MAVFLLSSFFAGQSQVKSIDVWTVTPPKQYKILKPMATVLAAPAAIVTATYVQQPSPQPTIVAVTGTKQSWMQAAGIPESDWQYVDYIVSRESTWNASAINSASGACGLVQALPCSKLGPNWSDPVVALEWQQAYVHSRYGSYANACSFWIAHNWY